MGKIVGNTVGVPNPVSDWNQNDIAKAGYVKNRTHYEEAKSIVKESYVSFDGAYMIFFTSDFELNKTYHYNVDGTVGTVKFTTEDETVDVCGTSCGLYYLIENEAPSYYLVAWFAEDAVVDFYEEKVVTLPEKYIPDSIASKDYVDEEIAENRVCYDTKVILGEAHFTSEDTQLGYFDGICDVRIPKELVEVGKEYKYTINGKSGTFVFDDSYMDFGGTSGYVYDCGDEYDWQTNWSYGDTIDIVLFEGELKQIDEKFIPGTIARKSDIVQDDWNQNTPSNPDYVKNRTHYDATLLVGEAISSTTPVGMHLSEPFHPEREYTLKIDGNEEKITTYYSSDGSWSIRGSSGSELIYTFEGDDYVTLQPTPTPQEYKLYRVEIVQLPEKFIPDTIARKSDIGDINVALDEIIALQEEFMIPSGDEVSY